uniref:CABIT domain-containing protein n=1 Tax=Knipowitschia caucasica TaxID=637954 RepID=A0AAV2MAD6_KNICA
MAEIMLPLQEYCASLDESCLPKILKVCSGVYFQGSVYELSGSEVCFSTGDLVKIISIELLSVSCENVSNSDRFELPIQHTGLFKVIPEQMPYSTVDEMMKLRPIGLESSLPFAFTSHTKITICDLTLSPGTKFTVKSLDKLDDGSEHIRCSVHGQQDTLADMCIPVSTTGQFYECESAESFSLSEIMSSPSLRSRRFRFANATKGQEAFLFSPVYQVHAMMSLRKHVLQFPSSLEVDVVDVTDTCNADFVIPLSLSEILSQPDKNFPAVLEILEGPGSHTMFKCNWKPELKTYNKVIFHKKGTSAFVLISNLKSKKTPQYFLVSQQYGGRFKRRPREFSSVYEIYAASVNTSGFKVTVTRNCEEVEEDGIPALGVAEQLEIVRTERMELPSTTTDASAPPRPPKRNVSSSKSIKKSKKKSKVKAETVPSAEFTDLSLSCKRRPPPPPSPPETREDQLPPSVPRKPSTTTATGKALPNTYVKIQGSIKTVQKTAEDSDHEYESMDELSTFIRNAQENVLL